MTIQEIDDEDTPAPVIDLIEYKKRKEYEEFWSDPCWSDPAYNESLKRVSSDNGTEG